MSVDVSTRTSGSARHFEVPVYFVNPARRSTMRYWIAATGKKQAHLRKRFVIEPEIDLGAYRVVAVIDYLTLTVALRKPSQGHVLHRLLTPHVSGAVRVEPLDLNKSSVRRFGVTFNEPRRAEVEKALTALKAVRPFAAPPLLSKLEVSVDWYLRASNQHVEPLAKIAAVLQKHLVPLNFDYKCSLALPRVVYSKLNGEGELVSDTRKLIGGSAKSPEYFSTFVDGTNYVGAKNSSAMWRIMIKTTDDRKSLTEFRPLPPEEWRTRIEVVLSGSSLEELGIRQLSDLTSFKFERLRKSYFSHWLTTVPSPIEGIERSRYLKDLLGMLQAFRAAGGLAARREELAALARNRKLLASRRSASELVRMLKSMEVTLSYRRGFRLDYRSLNSKIETALRSLRW